MQKSYRYDRVILSCKSILYAPGMLDRKVKEKVIDKFKTHATDTGSPEVQVAILSHEIKELSDHLATHRKDHSSRRGLIRMVSERRRLLRYLKHESAERYDVLVKKLGLK